MSTSMPMQPRWTAEEQKKLDDLLEAGKEAAEIATVLQTWAFRSMAWGTIAGAVNQGRFSPVALFEDFGDRGAAGH